MEIGIFCFFISFLLTFLILPPLIKALKKAGFLAQDMNKPGKVLVPEMGGIALVFGIGLTLIILIAFKFFLNYDSQISTEKILAALLVLVSIGFIGLIDDLLVLSQKTKVILALFAGLPLGVLKMGVSQMHLPFLGQVDFGIFYPLILVPIGISGAANAFDMLAGFNGLESGLGFIASIFLTLIAFKIGAWESFLVLISLAGSCLALYYFNRYPSKIFVGDIGTMTIGALIATSVVLGNFEVAGLIIFFPHFLDFFIKIRHKLPKTFGEYKEGKLYPPQNKAKGLGQLIMKIFNGISEKNLVRIIFLIEIICGIFALLYYF